MKDDMTDRAKAFAKWWSLSINNSTLPELREQLAREAYYAAWGDGSQFEAANEIERLREDTARQLGYATRLLESFVVQHFPPNPDWKPLPDLFGVLTQLDNASTIARDYKAEIERLRAELQKIANKCPATCEVTLAHEMADDALAALTGREGRE